MFKKSLIVMAFVVWVSVCTGNAERVVVIEQMTTTDTSDCADTTCKKRNEHLYAILDTCKNKAVGVFYYKDLLTNDDVDTRCDYYAWYLFGNGRLNGRTPPDGVGELFPDDVYYINTSSVNDEYNQEPLFDFFIGSKLTGTSPNHGCSLTVISRAIKDYTSTGIIRMHVAIIENEVNYQQSTGSAPENGQAVHDYVCRKMLPSGAGTYIGDQTAGQENVVRVAYTNNDDKQDYEKIRIVAFVQDYSNKKIIGAYVTTKHPFQDITQNSGNTKQEKPVKMAITRVSRSSLLFFTPKNGNFFVNVYTANGKMIYNIVKNDAVTGINTVNWDLKSISNGLYFIELRCGKHIAGKCIVLL